MPYTLQAFKSDTLATIGGINASATSCTLTTGNFGTPSTGPQVLCFDPTDPTKKEIVIATIVGTSVTSMTRGVDQTTAQAHSQNAPVIMDFVPTHYQALVDGTGTNLNNWTSWTPTLTAGGSMTYTSTSIIYAKYAQYGNQVFYKLSATGTTGGTASDRLKFTVPIARVATTNPLNAGSGETADGAAGLNARAMWTDTSLTTLSCLKYDGSNYGLGAGRTIIIAGFYLIN